MPPQPSQSFAARILWLIPVLLSVALVATAIPSVGLVRAQDNPASNGDGLVSTQLETITPAPSFVRLLRITMEPGSSVPVRSHPGPKVDRIESGTLTVNVRESEIPATIQSDGGEATDAPTDEDFELTEGDVITLPSDTIYQFRNDGDEPVVLLTVVILPAGHQRPPGIAYPEGEPPADAYAGVSNTVLGDGVATQLPVAPVTLEIARVEATPETPVPPFEGPVLLSLVEPAVDATVDAGLVQYSRTVAPGPQRESDIGAQYSLVPGDAFFFPYGNDELRVAEELDSVQLLRLTIAPAAEDAEMTGTPVPSGTERGAVTFLPPTERQEPTARRGTPRAQIQQTPTADEATATPTPSEAQPTEEAGGPAADLFAIGTTVATTDVGVNIRTEPSVNGDVVATIDEVGSQFVIIGPPVEADDYTWYPVQGLDDPSISGWVVADFLEVV